MRKKRNFKLSPDDPETVKAFAKHCAEGWSPISFCGKLRNQSKDYYCLKNTNEEFREIADMYTKVNPLSYKQRHPDLYPDAEYKARKNAIRESHRDKNTSLPKGCRSVGEED